jgi:hypothetical protein
MNDDDNPFADPNSFCLTNRSFWFATLYQGNAQQTTTDCHFKPMKKIVFLGLFILSEVAALFAASILIPMDEESQKNHLKAYGITYWVLNNGNKVNWLLNYQRRFIFNA